MDCRENPTPWPEGTEFDEKNMRVRFTLTNDEDKEVEFEREFKWEVCDVCQGKGSHVNPAIDADHGITAQEFADDPEFREDYFSGVYDQPCNQCGGKRVMPVLRDPCPELERYQEDEYEYRALCEAERRMGA